MARPSMTKKGKPKDLGKTVKRLLSYLGKSKVLMIIVVLCVATASLCSIVATRLIKPAIDNLVKSGAPDDKLSAFISVLFLMSGIYLLSAGVTFTYNRIMLTVTTRTLYNIRVEMFKHMQKLPIKYFDTRTHGEIMSLYTNDTDTLREMLANSIVQFISSSITIVGTFISMLILSWQLTIIVVVMLAVMLLVVSKIGGKSGLYFRKQQAEIGKVNGFIEEMIEGQKVVKVFCHEGETKAEFDRINDELAGASKQAHTFANILMPIMGNLSRIHYAITAIVGAILAITTGSLSLGALISFLTYTSNFSMPITQLSQQLNAILAALAGAERIFALIDAEPEVDNGYVTLVNAKLDEKGNITETTERTGVWAWKHPHGDGTLTYTLLRGNVEFEDVTFGYKENKTVLKNVSLFAHEGQKIALVGSTGAGKTTITNLINRFYDVPDGKIRYDGININKIRKADLRRSLSMVLQDTHLFTGTVMDNIRYGRLDATDEDVIAAAKLANAHFFITHLPNGYETMLTADGANLSQGQRQLLAIARAAVADPPVLILDEATSSIDTRTEALIEKGMDSLMCGRTTFVIAHRLSTVRNSNAIMVLEGGEIIERGSHDELLEQQGKYYQLYTGMFELS